MDDDPDREARKRVRGSSDGDQKSAKKMHFANVEVSWGGDLQAAVEKYQVRAMDLRIGELKRQIATIETNSKTLESKERKNRVSLEVVQDYWQKLNLDLSLILQRIDNLPASELHTPPAPSDKTSLLSFLLEAPAPTEDSPDVLREQLQKKADFTRSLLERVVLAVQENKSRNDSLTNLLADEAAKSGGAAGEELAKELRALKESHSSAESNLSDVQRKNRQLANELNALRTRNLQLTEQQQHLRDRMEDLDLQLGQALRKIDKAARGDSLAPPAPAAAATPAHAPAAASSSTPAPSSAATDASVDTSTKERIEALTRDRDALQHSADLRLEEIQRLRDEKAQLSQKLAALQVDLNNPANLSTSVVERTRQYAALRTQYSQLLADFDLQRQQLAELSKGQLYFEACRADMQRLREVDDQKLEGMERHLQEVLGQLREAHTERNALAYRLEQKEAESSLKTVSEALRKSHAVQEKEVLRLRAEIQQLQRDVASYRAKQPPKPRFAGELELSQEVENLTKSNEEMTDQVAKLTQQLAEKEDTTLHVLKQKQQFETMHALWKKEREALEEKAKRVEERTEAERELATKLEAKVKALQDVANKAAEERTSLQKLMEQYKKMTHEANSSTASMRAEVEQLRAALATSKSTIEEAQKAREDNEKKAERAAEDVAVMRKRLERMEKDQRKTETSGAGSSVLNRFRCPVCSDNIRSHALPCRHTFCNDCIQANLKNRTRKCPSCKAPFSQNDVLPIYLES